LLDDFGGGCGQRIDLALAQVLTREKNMLTERHVRFPFVSTPIAG